MRTFLVQQIRNPSGERLFQFRGTAGQAARVLLRASIVGMDVRRYMTRNPVIVGPNDSVRKARLLMRQGHVRRLPVVEDRRVVGIVTDRDIWERSPACVPEPEEADGPDLADHLRIMGMMTLRPVTIPVTLSVVDAARRLRESRVGCLLVLEDGGLVGILTKSDLIDALLDGYGAPVNASRS